jgi:hypothetical protein
MSFTSLIWRYIKSGINESGCKIHASSPFVQSYRKFIVSVINIQIYKIIIDIYI